MSTLRATLPAVKKTSLYLSPTEEQRLDELARVEGRPKAEIIRQAIVDYRPRAAGDRSFALFDSGRGDGRSVADVPEAELLEGFGE